MDIDLDDIAYVPTTGVRRVHETPLVIATAASLEGYGCLVDTPAGFPIEIVRWPAQGWRPVDKNSGDQGGVTEGVFEFAWKGETLYARNNAVGDSYLFGWSSWPEEAAAAGGSNRGKARERALISGARTTTLTAARCSTRCAARALSCRWRCPATT
jgi:ureidoglycolate lyase